MKKSSFCLRVDKELLDKLKKKSKEKKVSMNNLIKKNLLKEIW